MDIAGFISQITQIRQQGNATEHSYRAALQGLFDSIDMGNIHATNEPKRIKVGAPDFVLMRKQLAIGYIEAKDLHVNIRTLKGVEKDQQERYRGALSNLIYTNCLDWDFYQNGALQASLSIATLDNNKVRPLSENFDQLNNLLANFVQQRPQTITSPDDLAQRMAGKARLIKDVFGKALLADDSHETELGAQYQAFQEQLVHDISMTDFADIYAETIAYGMFAARLHDYSLDDFSRQEALELLPKSNPFLRKLFSFISSNELDRSLAWVLDDLASIFQATNLQQIMAGFGTLTGREDPFLHFYETFLSAYNPEKRKARGVWYTPEPVVNFIVRAMDQLLIECFGLADGLADTSKVTIDWSTGQAETHKVTGLPLKNAKMATVKKEVHRVQLLDPATGTGTFLAEAIKFIAPKVKDVAPAQWNSYIRNDLIPRLHGFELLMASYAMCHLKLDMVLTELGYIADANQPERLSVYLTNSLEQGSPETRALPFARWLSDEARGANEIKNDMPIMCVLGNPPYSGISSNNSAWITDLINDYKYIDGAYFNERKHWLNDDYVKFIRMSSHLIEKNGEGILGFITNHGYLDNPTFRGMRWHMLKTFDQIYLLDLHGNAKKKEVSPDGEPDKNVFDIQQGVAIILAVKTKHKQGELAQVKHGDLWGKRSEKNAALLNTDIHSPLFQTIETPAPLYAFIKKDFSGEKAYLKGFAINDFMPENVTGIVSMGDNFALAENKNTLSQRLDEFFEHDITEPMLRQKYSLGKNYANWIISNKANLKIRREELKPVPISYRPFDTRWTYFDNRILWRWRKEVMQHMLSGDNVGLATARSNKNPTIDHFYVTDKIMETKCAESSTQSALFPLYLYPTEQDMDKARRVNFEPKLHAKMLKSATDKQHGAPEPEQIFDYIYGVLHSPDYRQTYAEFLKSDFPRIPWPKSPQVFWDIAQAGEQLRRLHLMQPAAIGQPSYRFLGDGDSVIDKPSFKHGQVWINAGQYFDNVPEQAWEFYIGGYQPAQKWLKDRKGQPMSFDDIKHYRNILEILVKTAAIMQSIKLPL